MPPAGKALTNMLLFKCLKAVLPQAVIWALLQLLRAYFIWIPEIWPRFWGSIFKYYSKCLFVSEFSSVLSFSYAFS